MQNDSSLPPAATAALARLILERVITRFDTHVGYPSHAGSAPEVHVWVRGQDELSVARVRKLVKEAIGPLMRASVVVHPGARPNRDNCGND
jgi:hypothetical protein